MLSLLHMRRAHLCFILSYVLQTCLGDPGVDFSCWSSRELSPSGTPFKCVRNNGSCSRGNGCVVCNWQGIVPSATVQKERSTHFWPCLSVSVAQERHFLAGQVHVHMVFIMKCGLNKIPSTRISCVDRLSWGFLRAFPVLSASCLQHCSFLTLILKHRDWCVMPHIWLHRHKRLFLDFHLREENFLIASSF